MGDGTRADARPRLRRTLGALAATAALALPATGWAQSLTDALILAYESSPLLAQQRNLLRVQDEDVAVAVSALRPTINYLAETQLSDTFSGPLGTTGSQTVSTLGLTLDFLLLDGGRRAFNIGAAKEAVLAARWQLVQVEQDVLGDAVDAYLALALAVRTVDVRESNLRLLETQLEAAEDRFEVGEVTRTDVAIAQSRLAAAQSLLAAARGQVDIAREQYRLATGELPTGTLAPLPPMPALPPTLDRAQALAVQVAPTIKALQHNVVAGELLVQLREANRLPQVALSGQVGLSSNDRPESAAIGISGTGPIYTGGQLSALSRQATAQVNATRAQLAQQARLVTNAVGQAWSALEVARVQVMASDEQIRAAQLAFEGFREEASLGARTTLDVLDAEQELLDARVLRLEAETQLQGAFYDVLAAIGLLTTDHLGLNVERYDPTAYYNAVRTAPATAPGLSSQGNRLDRVLSRFGRGD